MLHGALFPRGRVPQPGYDGAVTPSNTLPPTPPASSPSPLRPSGAARVLGLLIDWLLCMLISSAAFPMPDAPASGLERVLLSGQPWATLGIWAVQHWILVATIGITIGHRIAGLRVLTQDGHTSVGFRRSAIRTLLIALVIPALVWDQDGRALHDRAAGTVLVRTRVAV